LRRAVTKTVAQRRKNAGVVVDGADFEVLAARRDEDRD
jgi:hypothetical protein